MNKLERIQATIQGKETDRVPCSVWMHLSEVDQDPISLAQRLVEDNKKYDYDFIKLMPFGAYTTHDWGAQIKFYCDPYKEPVIINPGIQSSDDYLKMEPLAPTYGTWGKTLQLTQEVAKIIDPTVPFIQTVFSPLTTLKKLAGDRLKSDLKEHPEKVHQALAVITVTTIDFVKANIEAGVSGFFLGSQTASYDYMSDVEYAEFCKPYDFLVCNAFGNDTILNVAHMHGSNIMFDIVKDYPVHALNWHDRDTEPSLKEAKQMTDKVLLGGIHEVPMIIDGALSYKSFLSSHSADEVEEHVRQAIESAGRDRLIIGPGCVADPRTSEANLHAVRKACGN